MERQAKRYDGVRIGVLALQGDFREHRALFHRLGVEAPEIRLPAQLAGLDGLVIPGGESTTIGKLATTFELLAPLRDFGQSQAIWGTCAGAIFLSKDAKREQPLLGLMRIKVNRNAFGRQLDSFETDLTVPALEDPERPFRAVFIRAPLIESVGKGVQVIARLPQEDPDQEGAIVGARQGMLLATSFHPELTDDPRFHQYFLSMVEEG
jgi:5'-phosphate synthase pdxT subunit